MEQMEITCQRHMIAINGDEHAKNLRQVKDPLCQKPKKTYVKVKDLRGKKSLPKTQTQTIYLQQLQVL